MRVVLSLLVLFFSLCGAVFGQTPILSFSSNPPILQLTPNHTVEFQIVAANGSAYTADNLGVTITTPPGLTITPAKGQVAKIVPFTKARVNFSITAAANLAPGEYAITASFIYTYCTDVNCFQIEDSLNIPVQVMQVLTGPVEVQVVKRILPPWVIPGIGLFLLAGGIGLWVRGIHWPLYFVLFLFVVGGFAYGIHLGQHEQAQGIASVLCTSCVGIEAVEHTSPRLSPAARAALAKINSDIDLTVFYAPWCHTCPYAEAMVKKMAVANPHIKYRFVDVSTARDIAVQAGVIRNQRTIVPAILRTDTGAVIFGIRDLEARLLQLLGVGN